MFLSLSKIPMKSQQCGDAFLSTVLTSLAGLLPIQALSFLVKMQIPQNESQIFSFTCFKRLNSFLKLLGNSLQTLHKRV